MAARPRIRRLVRTLGIVFGSLLALVLIAVVLLLVRPIRQAILDEGLRRVDDALPGELTVGRAEWPKLSRLELSDLIWTREGLRLVAAEELAVEVDLRALVRKDVHVRELELLGLAANVPELSAAFADSTDVPEEDTGGSPPAFPRPGAIPLIPSIAIDTLRLEAGLVQLADSLSLRAEVSLSLDLRAEHPPRLELSGLDAEWLERGWRAESGSFTADLATAELDGRIDLDLDVELPLALTLRSESDRSYELSLGPDGAESPPSEPGLLVVGSFRQRSNGAISSLDYDATLRTPKAETVESLAGRPGLLDPIDHLGDVLLDAAGTLDLDEQTATATIEVGGTLWDGSLTARLAGSKRAIELSELRVVDAGLVLEASGNLEGKRYRARVDAGVEGLDFLEGFVETGGLPADLRGRLTLDLSGEGSRLEPQLVVEAAAPSSGLDSLRAWADGSVDGAETDLRIGARTLVMERFAAGVDARLRNLDAPRIHLAPIRVGSELASVDRPGRVPSSPTLSLDSDAGSIRIDGLLATGDLGELRVDGNATRSNGGRAELQLRWPEAPSALEWIGIDAAVLDSLLAPNWSRSGVPRITAVVDVAPDADAVAAQLHFELPPPWHLAPGLPDTLYAIDGSPLLGRLAAEWRRDASWRADLEMGETAWLDSAFVHAHGMEGTAWLDSLLLKGGPVRATAAGRIDSTEVDAKLQLDLTQHPAVALLAPGLPADLRYIANLRAGIAGDPQAPDARAELRASARTATLRLPLLSAEAEMVEGNLHHAIVETPGRTSIGKFTIDASRLEARPERPDRSLFPLWVSAEVRGDAEWVQIARVDSAEGAWSVSTDTLAVGALGHYLESLKPFELVVAPDDGSLRLTDLDLAGDAGEVIGAFSLEPDGAVVDMEVHLNRSLPSTLVEMPIEMLPSGYHLTARGTHEQLDLSLWFEDLQLGPRQNVLARIDAHRDGEQVEVSLRATDMLGVLAHGDIVLPYTVDLAERRFQWHDGPLTGSVEVDSFPLPPRVTGLQDLGDYLLGARDETAPLLDANLELAGTGNAPVAGAKLSIGFPNNPRLVGHRIRTIGVWTGGGGAIGSLSVFETKEEIESLTQLLPSGGVGVIGGVDRAGSPLASFKAGFPLSPDAKGALPGFGPDDLLVLDVKAEPLVLRDWNALMPRGIQIQGNLYVSANGEGPLSDFPLNGYLRLDRVRFQQSFGSSGTLDGRIDFSGSSAAPVIEGRIEIPNAQIRLPESRRNLHPVRGRAQLWELQTMSPESFAEVDIVEVDWGWSFSPEDTAVSDSTGVVGAPEPIVSLAEATTVDVKIHIPNSFWIRGQGLDIQLAGDLRIELRDGLPRVVGELRAIGGQFEVVGARLRLDRGRVTFHGGDTANPTLDLELSQDRGEVKVIVRVTGTAELPRLEFDSDPAMSQTDIMSYLLFGSSSSNLDGAQTQLLQDQAATALNQFAAPLMENELTESLGLSMMRLTAGNNPNDGLSLQVGRYITPQVLIKYEQSLKDRQRYTVNLEYWLNRNFRVETRLSDSKSTGIQLHWSNDY